MIDSKSKYLGLFTSDEDAAKKYNQVALQVFGDRAGSVARMAGDLLQRARLSRSQITGDRP